MGKKTSKVKKTPGSKGRKEQEVVADPLDAVIRLTETELLRLGKISSEMRAALLSAKMAAVECHDIKSRAEAELRKKDEERVSFVEEARQLKASYDRLTSTLATKYGIEDPTKMIVDPDTGVVRDLRTI